MAAERPDPQPWRTLESRTVYSDRWITLRSDTVETARGGVVSPFHVLEFRDWVATVAITPADEIVLVREYRHGAGTVIHGLPAGVADAAEPPAETARRELAEETGYTAAALIQLPGMYANAANQTNRAWHFLAHGARLAGATNFDPNEDIATELADFPDFYRRLREGEIWMTGLHMAAVHQAAGHILAGAVPELAGLRARLAASLGLGVG